MMNQSKNNSISKPDHRRIWQNAILLVIILIGALVSGGVLYLFARRLTIKSLTNSGSQPRFQTSQKATQAALKESTPLQGNPSVPAIEPTLANWDGVGRVTVLLMGLDYRDWEAGSEASRSDTMILLTLDPLNKTAGILSIPRDMWVAIPGFQHGKINTAYFLGDAYKLPGGGPGLAVKTVEQFLGIPINYYAQVDFEAFVRFIDEIGGVKINVPEKISIDPLGDNNTKTLKPGVQTLSGELALAYARNRHTQGGDFDRAKRQQQVILGIRDRILDFQMLPTLISKAPALYQELASGIHTNLGLEEMIKLANLANQVPDGNIHQGVIGSEYVIFGRSPDDLSILIPIPDKVHILRDEIFASSGAIGPLAPGSIQEKMEAEGARISLRNGSQSPDLSGRTRQYLRSMGADVVDEGDADKPFGTTTLIDHTGKPYMMKFLSDLMGVPSSRVVLSYDPTSPVDIEVMLGNDWSESGKLP